MNNINGLGPRRSKRNVFFYGRKFLLVILLVFLIGGMHSAWGQVAEHGNEEHPSLWVGGGASVYYVQYGSQKLVGATGFTDADSARRIGIEGEGRWLEFHQFANVHAETYMIGPRYHFDIGRFQPYIKGLAGLGRFNFPYNYAHGSYVSVALGGGLDYSLSHRWSVRIADVEYQDWPQFTFGAMTSVGVTSGIRYRIF
jgi:opacity protein-like surface antigen